MMPPIPTAAPPRLLMLALEGRPVPFEAEVFVYHNGELIGEKRTFYLAWPTTEEYDNAFLLYELSKQVFASSSLLEELADDMVDIDGQTWKRRDLVINWQAMLRRDRWLTAQLLCDEKGRRLFDMTTAEGERAWERLPMSVKEAARPVLWEMLTTIHQIPFVSAPPSGPASSS